MDTSHSISSKETDILGNRRSFTISYAINFVSQKGSFDNASCQKAKNNYPKALSLF